MFSVAEARQALLGTLRPRQSEVLPFADAAMRVLAHDVVAESPLPPFAQSAMDGFAVRSEDTRRASRDGPVSLRVLGTLGAGQLTRWTVIPGAAIRIMTGAPIPDGADAVVKREDTTASGKLVSLFQPVSPRQHILPIGHHIPVGATLLRRGEVMTPWAIGVCAAIGLTHVGVVQRPRVGVLALGDELVPPHVPPAPGQIRVSNLYAVCAGVGKYGGVACNLGIAGDRLQTIEDALLGAGDVDLLITLGGSQRGDFDYVEALLSGPGSEMVCRDIAANYVRSMIIGRFEGIPLCGLPGAPVASMVAFEAFVRMAIWKLAGRRHLEPPRLAATLTQALPATGGWTHFQPVWLEGMSSGLRATPLPVRQAPHLPPITVANGLIGRAPESPACQEGSEVSVDLIEPPQPGRQGESP
jgi:molybdopterin molybdotransferase